MTSLQAIYGPDTQGLELEDPAEEANFWAHYGCATDDADVYDVPNDRCGCSDPHCPCDGVKRSF